MDHGILTVCYVREIILVHIPQKYVDSINMNTSVPEVKYNLLRMSCSFMDACEAHDVRDFR